jgi:UDP-glucose 4-epimerase
MMGCDPRVQVLPEEDSVAVLAHALGNPVPGAVNVAGAGTIALSAAIRSMGRIALPVAHPLFRTVAGAMGRLGLPPMSDDTVRYLRYGRGVATDRMTNDLRFVPRYDTRAAIAAVAGALGEAA